MHRLFGKLAAMLAVAAFAPRGVGQTIYYLQTNIERIHVDGSPAREYIGTSGGAMGLAVGTGTSRVYWSEQNGLLIRSFDVDDPHTFAWACADRLVQEQGGGGTVIPDVAVDGLGQAIYWLYGVFGVDTWSIKRANAIDGTNVETVLSLVNTTYAGALFLDTQDEVLCWGDGSSVGPGAIKRAAIGGGEIQTVLTNLTYRPVGIAMDHVDGKLYWCDGQGQQFGSHIYRVNVDGSGTIEIVALNVAAVALAIDESNRKLYWAEPRAIRRANLDGTSVEPILETTDNIRDLAIDLGTTPPLPQSCRKPFDTDFDRDIDLADFATYQNCWTGPRG